MKLYYHPASITSRPLMLYVAENDLDVELKVVDLMTGAHHEEPFINMNPNRLVPVLDDAGFILTESSAILKYLADKYDLPTYPKELKARARVNERMDWFNTQFYREYGYHLVYPQIFPHHRRADEAAQEGTISWGKERAAVAMQLLDDHIIGNYKYVCGDDLTIADFMGASMVTAGDHIRVDFSKFPNVKRWLETMRLLPTWNKTNEVHYGLADSLKDKQFHVI